MNGRSSRPQMRVYRGSLPLWAIALFALLAFPVGLTLLVSFAVAAVGLALAAGILPLFFRRRAPRDPDCIELDPSDYKVVDRRERR